MATVTVGECVPCCAGRECGQNLCLTGTPRSATLTVSGIPGAPPFPSVWDCSGLDKVFPLTLVSVTQSSWSWVYAENIDPFSVTNTGTISCDTTYDKICDEVTVVFLPGGFPDAEMFYTASADMSHHPSDTSDNAGTLSIRASIRGTYQVDGCDTECFLTPVAITWGKTLDANGIMEYDEDTDRWFLATCTLSQVLDEVIGGFGGCTKLQVCDASQITPVFAF